MKVRYATKCGRCGVIMNPGTAMSRVFGAPWHVECVIAYQKVRRSLVASARTKD